MDFISGWCTSERRLEGLTAIVTGCNSGLGKETALDLYTRGASVIMACRDIRKTEVAKKEIEETTANLQGKGTLILMKLDLASIKSIKEFTLNLNKEPKLHILVNNAGIFMCPEGWTEDGFETHMATNYFGPALLTLLLLPKLIESAPSRIVFVSSILHKVYDINLAMLNSSEDKYNPFKAYCQSKAAILLFSRALAQKLQKNNIKGVTTYSVHPGVISTDLGRHFSQTIFTGATWIAKNIFSWILKSQKCGAQTSIYCAVDEACADETGLYYSDCAVKLPSKQCQDNAVADELWDLTIEKLCSSGCRDKTNLF